MLRYPRRSQDPGFLFQKSPPQVTVRCTAEKQRVQSMSTSAAQLSALVFCVVAVFYLDQTYDTSRSAPSQWDLSEVSSESKRRDGDGLQVFGAGLPKTGTASLAAALDGLGYKTFHFPQHMTHHFDFWRFLNDGTLKRPDWRQLYANVTAIADHPAVTHMVDIMRAYPDAKVVLTVRDVDELMVSMRRHAAMLDRVRLLRLFSFAPRVLRMSTWLPRVGLGRYANVSKSSPLFPMQFIEGFPEFIALHDTLLARLYGSAAFDEPMYRKTYEEHVAAVKRTIPAQQLLVFDVKRDGWEKLCAFLGKKVPSVPWVHANKAGVIEALIFSGLSSVVWLSVLAHAVLSAPFLLLARGVWRGGRRTKYKDS